MNSLIALIDFYREVVPFLRLHHNFSDKIMIDALCIDRLQTWTQDYNVKDKVWARWCWCQLFQWDWGMCSLPWWGRKRRWTEPQGSFILFSNCGTLKLMWFVPAILNQKIVSVDNFSCIFSDQIFNQWLHWLLVLLLKILGWATFKTDATQPRFGHFSGQGDKFARPLLNKS